MYIHKIHTNWHKNTCTLTSRYNYRIIPNKRPPPDKRPPLFYDYHLQRIKRKVPDFQGNQCKKTVKSGKLLIPISKAPGALIRDNTVLTSPGSFLGEKLTCFLKVFVMESSNPQFVWFNVFSIL